MSSGVGARLGWPDYVVLAAFLAISLGIGVYHSLTGGRQRTTEEFIMANRRLGIIPTTLSLFVSFQSAIAMLGFPAEMYVYGVQFMIWAPTGYALSTLLVERLVVPWIFPLQLVSVNDVSLIRVEFFSIKMSLQTNVLNSNEKKQCSTFVLFWAVRMHRLICTYVFSSTE